MQPLRLSTYSSFILFTLTLASCGGDSTCTDGEVAGDGCAAVNQTAGTNNTAGSGNQSLGPAPFPYDGPGEFPYDGPADFPYDGPGTFPYGGSATGVRTGQSTGGTTGGSTGGSTGSTNAPSLDYLDCSNLDPDKVYVHGQVQRGFSTGFDVVFLPEDASQFCLGFPAELNEPQFISADGHYVWSDGSNVLALVQEPLGWDERFSEWEYPSNTELNDRLVFEGETSADVVFKDPDNEVYYYLNSSRSDIYRSDQTEVYFVRPTGDSLLGIAPGGRMIFGGRNGLYVIEADQTETPIELPSNAAGSLDFHGRARMFTSLTSGNPSVWLHVEYADETHHRWSVDLTDAIAVDDGEFAALPNGMDPEDDVADDGRFDGQGYLWQRGYARSEDQSFDVVLKRPLSSSTEVSSIEFSEEDYTGGVFWDEERRPVAAMNHPFPLVTGQ